MKKSPSKPENWRSRSLTYRVHHFSDLGVIIECDLGNLPSADVSALARAYDIQGLRVTSTEIPVLLNMRGIAFVRSRNVEEDWLTLIQEELTNDGDGSSPVD